MKKALGLALVLLATFASHAAGQQAEQARKVRNQYIVVFKDTVPDVPGLADRLAKDHGGMPLFVYEHALRGFAVALPGQAAEALSRNPNVAYVEPDSVVTAFASQANPTWGLDRIDQRSLPLDRSYQYDLTGYGVTAYIIDTGIRTSHSEFGGRAISGYDFVDLDAIADDCNGHGTHVAGTVGGTTYGVAKGVDLVAVRVLGCDGTGTTSGVIAGIDWVTENAAGPAVANMSLGGGASTALDAAVRRSISSGVAYAVSAGNGNAAGVAQNACNYSPARVGEAMTISATDSADRKASWANYGGCVDWFAPGVGITSAWYTSGTATRTLSGTSMATPHTTGVAALYLQTHPDASPADVRDALFAAATRGIVTGSNTASNDLLYSGLDGDPPPPPPTITLSVSGQKVKTAFYATLAWSGATSASVDVYRNGTLVTTTANDGDHTERIGKKGGTYTYRICQAGTTTCSNDASVTF
jgi:subtilisin family serine protease